MFIKLFCSEIPSYFSTVYASNLINFIAHTILLTKITKITHASTQLTHQHNKQLLLGFGDCLHSTFLGFHLDDDFGLMVVNL